MPALVWNPKDPAETVARMSDWTVELAGDTIASYDLAISSGDATISKEESTVSTITAWIEGGTDATATEFLFTVTTASGQILTREYTLLVSAGANAAQPTTTIKRTLVGQAYTECALNGWEYDVTPEEQNTALTRLDMLMWELRGRGIELSYNFPAAMGGGDLADELGCPDQAFYGLSVLLALRLCPTMMKRMSVESNRALNDAMKALRAANSNPLPTVQLRPGTPLGSGNRPWATQYPFAV